VAHPDEMKTAMKTNPATRRFMEQSLPDGRGAS